MDNSGKTAGERFDRRVKWICSQRMLPPILLTVLSRPMIKRAIALWLNSGPHEFQQFGKPLSVFQRFIAKVYHISVMTLGRRGVYFLTTQIREKSLFISWIGR